jgi:hypothetical protein
VPNRSQPQFLPVTVVSLVVSVLLSLFLCAPRPSSAASLDYAAAVLSAGLPADGLIEPDGSLWTLSGSWGAFPRLARAAVAWSPRSGGGAWSVASDGGVFTYGTAPFDGSTGGVDLARPVVGIESTPDGGG